MENKTRADITKTTAYIEWMASTERKNAVAIQALGTIDECLLASHNAVIAADPDAAHAVAVHARGSIDHDGSPEHETMIQVITGNIGIAHAMKASTDQLPMLDVGYGTVVTRR